MNKQTKLEGRENKDNDRYNIINNYWKQINNPEDNRLEDILRVKNEKEINFQELIGEKKTLEPIYITPPKEGEEKYNPYVKAILITIVNENPTNPLSFIIAKELFTIGMNGIIEIKEVGHTHYLIAKYAFTKKIEEPILFLDRINNYKIIENEIGKLEENIIKELGKIAEEIISKTHNHQDITENKLLRVYYCFQQRIKQLWDDFKNK